MSLPEGIVRQINHPPVQVESNLATLVGMLRDIRVANATLETVKNVARREWLPIGSVEFVRLAMSACGVTEPKCFTYPEALREHLGRSIRQGTLAEAGDGSFIKPTAWKQFTGFVYDAQAPEGSLDEHDLEQLMAIRDLPSSTPIWLSEPVKFVSEVRYYIHDGQVIGCGRYDDGDEMAALPDPRCVIVMAEDMLRHGDCPAGYSIDVGMTTDGRTLLVECNDGWALGFYKGTCDRTRYIEMLWARWIQIAGG